MPGEMEYLYPTSPNWYCTRILDSIDEGIICFGAKNSLFLWKVTNPKQPQLISHFVAHSDRVVSISLCRADREQQPVTGTDGVVPRQLKGCSAGEDGKVRAWNLRDMAMIAEHEMHRAKPTAVHWSLIDPQLIASGDEKGSVIVYNLESRDHWYWHPNPPHSHVFSLTFSPHARSQLAVGFKTGAVMILDVSKKNNVAIITSLRGHDDEVQSIVWCPFKRDPSADNCSSDVFGYPDDIIASSCKDRTIRVWSISKGHPVSVMHIPNTGGYQRKDDSGYKPRMWIALAWSPNPATGLVSSGLNGELIRWDITDLSRPKPLLNSAKSAGRAHNRIVFNIVCADADDRSLVSVSLDRQIIIWDAEKLSPLQVVPSLGGFVYVIAQSPLHTGKLALGVGDCLIRVCNTSAAVDRYDIQTFWQGIKSKVTALAWHPSKEGLLAYGTEDGRVGILNVLASKGPQISITYHKKIVYVVAWGPATWQNSDTSPADSGYTLYSVGDGVIYQHRPDNLLQRAVNVLGGPHGKGMERTELSWKPDFKYVAIGNKDGSIDIMKPPHLELVCSIRVHRKLVNCIRWHPEYTAQSTSPSPFRFCLASGTNEPVIHVFNLECVLSGEGVVSSGGETTVITESFRKLEGHTNRIVRLSFSLNEDGLLASASFDWTAQIWDIKHGVKMVANYRGHHGRLMSVQWSLDDPDLVYTGADDYMMMAWRISKQTESCPPSDTRTRSRTKPKSSQHAEGRDLTVNAVQAVNDTRNGNDRRLESLGSYEVPDYRKGDGLTSSDYAELSKQLEEKRRSIASGSSAASNRAEPSVGTMKTSENDSSLSTPSHGASSRQLSPNAARDGDVVSPERDGRVVKPAKGSKKKRTAKSLFPKSSMADNRGKAPTQQDCIDLARAKHSNGTGAIQAVLPENLSHLGCFVDRRATTALCRQEELHHVEHENFEQLVVLGMFKGSTADALKDVAKRRELNDFMMALAPSVSYEFWEEMCEVYVQQLIGEEMYHKAAAYLLTADKVHDAVRLLRDNGLFKDALCLARLRLTPNDALLKDVTENWGHQLVKDGNYELAAKCFLACGDAVESARCLAKRSDRAALRAAALVAMSANQIEASVIYVQKYVLECLVSCDWSDASELVRASPEYEYMEVLISTYMILVNSLSSKNIMKDLCREVPDWRSLAKAGCKSAKQEESFVRICKTILKESNQDMNVDLAAALVDDQPFLISLYRCWITWDIQLGRPKVDRLYARLLKLRQTKQSRGDSKNVLLEICLDVSLGALRLLCGDLDLAAGWFVSAVVLCMITEGEKLSTHLSLMLQPRTLQRLSGVLPPWLAEAGSKNDTTTTSEQTIASSDTKLSEAAESDVLTKDSKDVTESCVGNTVDSMNSVCVDRLYFDCLNSYYALNVIQFLLRRLRINDQISLTASTTYGCLRESYMLALVNQLGSTDIRNVSNCIDSSGGWFRQLSHCLLKQSCVEKCRLLDAVVCIQKAIVCMTTKHQVQVRTSTSHTGTGSGAGDCVNGTSTSDATSCESHDVLEDGVKVKQGDSADAQNVGRSESGTRISTDSRSLGVGLMLNDSADCSESKRIIAEHLSSFISSLVKRIAVSHPCNADTAAMEELVVVGVGVAPHTQQGDTDPTKTVSSESVDTAIEESREDPESHSASHVVGGVDDDSKIVMTDGCSKRGVYADVPADWFDLSIDEKYSQSYVSLPLLAEELTRLQTELSESRESSLFPHPLECAALIIELATRLASLANQDSGSESPPTLPQVGGAANEKKGTVSSTADLVSPGHNGAGDAVKSSENLSRERTCVDYGRFAEDVRKWALSHAYTNRWKSLFEDSSKK